MSVESGNTSEKDETQPKKYTADAFLAGRGYKDKFLDVDAETRKELLVGATIDVIQGRTQGKLKDDVIRPYVEKYIDTLSQHVIPKDKGGKPDFSALSNFTLDSTGALVLEFADGTKKELNINPEGKIQLSKIAIDQVRRSAPRENLKEELNTEAYLGGNIIVVFETVATSTMTTGALTYSTAIAGASLYHTIKGTQNVVKKIWYKTPSGSMESVDVSTIGRTPSSREQHSQKIIRMLGQNGIVMTEGGRFDKLPRVMTQRFITAIDNIKDPKQIGKNTPEDLERWKETVKKEVINFSLTHDKLEFSQFIKNFDLHFNNVLGGIGKIGKFGFTVAEKTLFWAVFFRSYGKNMQDTGMLAASLAEVGLFGAGAHIGGRAPGMLSLPAGLAGGVGAVVLGHQLGGQYGADKKFWTLYPDREDATKKLWGGEGNSLVGSILSGNAVHEYLDKGNADFRFSPKGGIDIIAPSYNGIDFRNSPWPKDWMIKKRGVGVGDRAEYLKPWTWLKEGPQVGQDTTIPEVDVLTTSINFKTHPREWMGLTVGRDVDLWNKRVEEYKVWLQKFINSLLADYSSESGIFRIENIRKVNIPETMTRSYLASYELDKSGNPLAIHVKNATLIKDEKGKWYEPISPSTARELQKQSILKARLQNALGTNDFTALKSSLGLSGDGGDNIAIIENIVSETLILAKDPNKQSQKKNTNFLVSNYTEYLTINQDYLAAEQIKLKNQETLLLGQVERFSKEVKDPKIQDYFLSLFGRILKKERLTGKTKDESKYFKELIKSEVPVANMDIKIGKQMEALFSAEGKTGLDKTVTIGDSFYEVLDKMVVYKRQKDFLENLEKYGRGHKWSAI